MDNRIRALEAKRHQLDAKRARLLKHVDALTANLTSAVGDHRIIAISEVANLEQCDEDDFTYGHWHFGNGTLSVRVRSSFDDYHDMTHGIDDEDQSWGIHPIATCKSAWIERLLAEPVMTSLLQHIDQQLNDRARGLDGALAAVERMLSGESAVLDAEMTEHLSGMGDDNLVRLWQDAVDATHADTADALTRCSRFIEAVCAKILRERGIDFPKDQSMSPLVKACLGAVTWPAAKEAEADVRQLLGGIQSICNGIGALRTHFGTAHGASSHLPPLDPGYAVFVKQATVAAATFLLNRHRASAPTAGAGPAPR
ncbi:abortive infection family protein [Burkholderia ubonensis]|uniref:abortive infection family protein n=1 Tax=Burkholderia ubonensis TaxID=101571 RepID=UPI00075E375A|nr:abortive infection family protein [Burkholderia ubonensis]KVL65425.1 hypothetical protein WJ48_01525 [Burkholderia ubonensis]KVL76337.1 hypothetical protein WJ49_11585 [Burkholderia ubonensis]KVL92082.1 hypothetical protein WJ50_10730 [Burkholderia ubonensis]